MANKKRKNIHKKATSSNSRTTEQKSNLESSTSNSNHNDRVRNNGKQRIFSSFPLHLVPNNEYAGKDNTRELQELCKGRVWVIPSFFSHKECQAWIEFCESFDNGDGGGFQYTAHPSNKYIANRECYRLQQENANELSEHIFQRLQGMTLRTSNNCDDDDDNRKSVNQTTACASMLSRIQEETWDLYPPTKTYKPTHCNPNIRVYRYDKGHAFGRHVDGSNIVSGICGGTTEMTMLIYLSTCQGGATRFHLDSGSGRRSSRSASSSFAFEPEVGALLLHVHGKYCLEHEADVVLGGQKYVLRTDLVYGNE